MRRPIRQTYVKKQEEVAVVAVVGVGGRPLLTRKDEIEQASVDISGKI